MNIDKQHFKQVQDKYSYLSRYQVVQEITNNHKYFCFTKNDIETLVNGQFKRVQGIKSLNKDNLFEFKETETFNQVSSQIISQVGFKSFTSVFKPYFNDETCYIDYYKRDYKFVYQKVFDMQETFKKQEIFKIQLLEKDLNKLNKGYLFLKGDIKDFKVSIIRYDEFIKNIPLKSSYSLFKDIQDNFFTNQGFKNNTYKKHRYVLNSFVIIVETVTRDNKFVTLYLNKPCLSNLLKTINLNTVKWSKTSNNKLLKQIRKYSYTYLDKEDKRKELEKKLKSNKKELKILDKKYSFYQKELLNLEPYKSRLNKQELKRLDKYNQELARLTRLNDKITNELDYINQELIELDKQEDNFKSNTLETETVNYSIKLTSYL